MSHYGNACAKDAFDAFADFGAASYDYSMARLVDQAGIDVILVGDSASNVMAGNITTLPITLDQMIYHAKSVVIVDAKHVVGYQNLAVDTSAGSDAYYGNSKLVKTESHTSAAGRACLEEALRTAAGNTGGTAFGTGCR